jgi:hypothetical protein
MPNFIRTKQIDQADLSGFFIDTIGSQSSLLFEYISGVTLNETVLLTGNQTISGIKTFAEGVNLNNINDLSLSGVNISIINGNVVLTNPVSAPNLVYNVGFQDISGSKTFRDNVSFAGQLDQTILLGLGTSTDNATRIGIPTGFNPTVSITRGALSPAAHGYGIVFAGGPLGTKKGYLTSALGGTTRIPTGYQYATLDWTNRILSGNWSCDKNIKVGDAYSVLTTGDETISGIKTFATGVNISGHVGIGINNNNKFRLYVRKSAAGVTVNPDDGSIAVFEGSGNSHITVLASNGQTAGVVLGSPADNFGSYLSWNHDNNELKLATDKSGGFISILTDDERVAVTITSGGNVGIGTISPSEKLQVVGNLTVSGKIINSGIADQFPAWTGARRYPPLDFFSATTAIPVTGTVNYFPFLTKKNTVNPVACVEMTTYSSNNPKIDIGIYSGDYGFQNAKLIASGSITGSILNTGIYRTTLNGTFNKGPYIVASMLSTGQGSTFRILGSHGFREHFGINTGSSILHGVNNANLTNILAETGRSILPQNIGSGEWYITAANVTSPLVFLEY